MGFDTLAALGIHSIKVSFSISLKSAILIQYSSVQSVAITHGHPAFVIIAKL